MTEFSVVGARFGLRSTALTPPTDSPKRIGRVAGIGARPGGRRPRLVAGDCEGGSQPARDTTDVQHVVCVGSLVTA
jgi:hypothetical protein